MQRRVPVAVTAHPDFACMNADELAALEHALQSDICRDSFADFVAEAWHLVPPARPYVANLASSALIAHLQAVADGEIRRLLVATPPGTGKSTIASVMYPAWRWARRPGWRVITASHAHRLALRDSVRTRRLVEGEWYRSRFAKDTWELRGDQNRGDDYENTKGGRRLAVGVGGALTGDRADEADCDDLLNAMDARSDAARRTVNDWVTWALMNRLDDPEHAPIVVIQQRLHGDDPIGHLLETGGWEYLRLPAEFDSRRRTVTCIWSDPRQEDGELLAQRLLVERRCAAQPIHQDASAVDDAGQAPSAFRTPGHKTCFRRRLGGGPNESARADHPVGRYRGCQLADAERDRLDARFKAGAAAECAKHLRQLGAIGGWCAERALGCPRWAIFDVQLQRDCLRGPTAGSELVRQPIYQSVDCGVEQRVVGDRAGEARGARHRRPGCGWEERGMLATAHEQCEGAPVFAELGL